MGNQIHEGVLSYEKEVLESVFDSRSNDVEDSPSDFGIDKSKFTYGPKQSKTSESDAKTSDTASCESNSSVETPDSVSKPAVNKPTIVSKSKVWSDAPIIEEYESDNDVIAARQNPSSQAAEISTARKVITAETPFTQTIFTIIKLILAGHTTVSLIRVYRETAVKTSAGQKGSRGNIVMPELYNKIELLEKKHTLIEAARTMLSNSFLPNTFWAEAVSTACYVLNRVLVTKPQNKTPYELITGKIPIISYIRPFGCHVTILNTIDHLGKFEEKSDEGFLVGKGPNWLFDLDYLTDSMNYQPVTAENKANKTAGPKEANHSAGTQDNIDAGNSEMEAEPAQEYFVLPLWSSYTSTARGILVPKTKRAKRSTRSTFLRGAERLKRQEKEANDAAEAFRKEFAQCTKDLLLQAGAARATSTNTVNTISTPISTASPSNVFSTGGPDLNNNDQDDSQIPALEGNLCKSKWLGFYQCILYEEGAMADFTSLETTGYDSLIPHQGYTPFIPQHPNSKDPTYKEEIITRISSTVCLLASFLRLNTRRYLTLKMKVRDSSLSNGCEEMAFYMAHLRWKSVYVQPPGAWYGTLSTFLLKSGYKRGTINKNLFIKKDKNDIMLVQVDDIIFGSIKKSWCDDFEALMKSRFQISSMGELTFFLGLQVKQKEDGIFISQDKYVAEILKKFDFASVKTASTLFETQKPLTKDEEVADVDVHLYRSMIGSLMYLTASRPDIMFAVCACSRFQVTPKTSHLHAVKRIFRYLKGKPKLGLWYPRVSSFDLEAYSDSDYAGCKKQTIVATSTIEAKYVAAANCRGQHNMHCKESSVLLQNKAFEIRYHFIRDAYEKKLIQVLKIHTDDNVADLLTKAFNVNRVSTVVQQVNIAKLS
ncbi:putative ribonuclease H-like domain-containing protein [Tanacetum coccineum]